MIQHADGRQKNEKFDTTPNNESAVNTQNGFIFLCPLALMLAVASIFSPYLSHFPVVFQADSTQA